MLMTFLRMVNMSGAVGIPDSPRRITFLCQFIEASGQTIGLVVRHPRIARRAQWRGSCHDDTNCASRVWLNSTNIIDVEEMASGVIVRTTRTHPTGHSMHWGMMYDYRPSLFALYPRDTVLSYLAIYPPKSPQPNSKTSPCSFIAYFSVYC
ncbi:hypothetical protein FOYG_11231 [Fusarium oxysporum NRRL 32931]|uniref:Uncharacterized protein n=1 Tax=Fusarium oxysporum NRRL 32931 TaxID=660029 RepID=W9I0R0_FUSOX|nr:hypothetical protein FOYG_11231 [Fusarium oxysporum NRRL 32931]EWY86871.1 hypothetical protein FOYG_11231 [Fusarium oxysporum NRRL 32931]